MRFFRGWPRLACVLAAAILAVPAAADDQITFDQVTSKWTVALDGTWSVDAEVTIRAPKDNITHVVRVPLTWSASTEKLEVIQARIDKPDGRSIILGPETIRDDPPTGDEYFHQFSDEHRMLITFPDAEAGDMLVIHTRRDVFKPRVPGGFMAAPVLDRSVGWEDTNFTFNIPIDMPFRFEMRGFDHQSEIIKDRVMHYFHSPKVIVPPHEVAAVGAFDRLPRFAVSTFRSYDEFGKAYATVLLPHAQVTPAITAMAAKLTESQKGLRAQAQVLYEWVRDNVRYIPIPLEESPPAPHDAEQVMTNRYGDDKDQAVLLYALLAARNIPAEFVLLNSSDNATIAEPPNIRPMNHMILYLPSGNLYEDTTLKVAPFGVLSFGEIGKPAIHLGTSGAARRQIPMPASATILSRMKTEMVLGADGSLTGTTKTTARGAFGVWLRTAALDFGENNPAAAVTLLRDHGTPGSGTFSFDPPRASSGDEYKVSGTFELKDQAPLLHGGYFSLWTGLRILPRPGDLLGGPMFAQGLRRAQTTFCYPGLQVEELSLTLPEGRVPGGLPEDVTAGTDLVKYRSHWSFSGRQVAVWREFQSLVPGPTCEGIVRDEIADVVAKIRTDLTSPIGIRQETPVETPGATPEANSK